jgi:hypothetical protein
LIYYFYFGVNKNNYLSKLKKIKILYNKKNKKKKKFFFKKKEGYKNFQFLKKKFNKMPLSKNNKSIKQNIQ